ncbi:MAG: hypothetical protein LBQ20_07795, partial [Rhodanobacter sp.]|nr:hypothetical protein [Rhodanobacter sp.]
SERKSLASDAAYTNQQVRREFLESEVIGPDVPKTVPKESRLHLMLPIQINKLGASFLRGSSNP